MKRRTWIMVTATALFSASALLYGIHYLLFRDAHHIFIYLVGDIAFVPVEVFLVVIILERVLERHEKKQRLQKLNMVVGTFFSELGTKLLGELTQCIQNTDALKPHLAVSAEWTDAAFNKGLKAVSAFDYVVDADAVDLLRVRTLLTQQRDLLLNLLANPNMLEHERFTDLLWAIFHLMEELTARESLDDLPATDRQHLAGDVKRAYSHLTTEWLRYCKHLKKAYPFIFSVVVRTHPLQQDPSPIVTS